MQYSRSERTTKNYAYNGSKQKARIRTHGHSVRAKFLPRESHDDSTADNRNAFGKVFLVRCMSFPFDFRLLSTIFTPAAAELASLATRRVRGQWCLRGQTTHGAYVCAQKD